MSEIIEVIFENIGRAKLFDVMAYFRKTNNDLVLIDTFFKNKDSAQILISGAYENLELNMPEKILIKLNVLPLHDKRDLRNVNLWIYINDLTFDLEFDFDLKQNESNIHNLVSDILFFSKRIAELFDSPNFYSGLEPAYDEDTRFFTKSMLGPLVLKN